MSVKREYKVELDNQVKAYPVEIYSRFSLRKFSKEWRWRVTATNGKIIGASTQGYSNYLDCKYNVDSLGLSLLTSSINILFND